MVLVADASKFPGNGIARVCGPGDLDGRCRPGSRRADRLAALADAGAVSSRRRAERDSHATDDPRRRRVPCPAGLSGLVRGRVPGRVTTWCCTTSTVIGLRTIGRVLADCRADAGATAPRVQLETDLDVTPSRTRTSSSPRSGSAGLAGRVCDERAALDARGRSARRRPAPAGSATACARCRWRCGSPTRCAGSHPCRVRHQLHQPGRHGHRGDGSLLGDRVVGICDSPVGMFQRVARALDVDLEAGGVRLRRASTTSAGCAGCWSKAGRPAPRAARRPGGLLTTEEGRLFGPDWLASLGTMPNEYLWYWYYHATRSRPHRLVTTRGELLLRQQPTSMMQPSTQPSRRPTTRVAGMVLPRVRVWEQTRLEREADLHGRQSRRDPAPANGSVEDLDGGGYDRVALAVMRAVARTSGKRSCSMCRIAGPWPVSTPRP